MTDEQIKELREIISQCNKWGYIPAADELVMFLNKHNKSHQNQNQMISGTIGLDHKMITFELPEMLLIFGMIIVFTVGMTLGIATHSIFGLGMCLLSMGIIGTIIYFKDLGI